MKRMIHNTIPEGAMVNVLTGDYAGEWGIVKLYDGEYYHVALWNGSSTLIFDRDELELAKRSMYEKVYKSDVN